MYSELAHSLPSAFTPHVDYMHALWIQWHGMLHTCTCVACIQQRFPVTLLFWHVLLIPFTNYLLDGLPKDYCCYLEFLEKKAEEILLAFCLFLIFSEVSHMLDYPYPHLLFFLLKISLKRTGEKQYVTALFWNLLAKILRSFLKPRFYESFDNIKNEDLNENKLLRPSRFNVVLMKRR